MKKTKKAFITILTIALTICMSIPTNTATASSSKAIASIDSELQTLLQGVPSNERIPVDIWLYETATSEIREERVFSEIGFSKASILSNAKNAISAEKIDEYIRTERMMYTKERAEQYALFRLDYSSIEGLQETSKTSTRLFYSQYAPMISAELTPVEIKRLANDSRVQAIYYSPPVSLMPSSDISIPSIRADYTRDTLNYSGNGVKIGLLEAEGFPDQTLISSTITYDDNVSATYSQHASIVASIMCAKSTTIDGITYEGIVPDATLYATHCGLGGYTNWRAAVEWLLSKEVNVINMSANFDNPNTNYYGSEEKWLDHVAITHSVHFVNSAGNAEDHKIRGPGMAYNILTVGAIDDHNTKDANDDNSDDSLATFSCYEEAVSSENGETLHPTNKPDLVAPGFDINTAAYTGSNVNIKSGTSFAAPHVTAVIAQLCQRRPALKVQQDAMKAILTASIPHATHAYTPSQFYDYNAYGAGVIDARSAYYTVDNYRFTMSNFAANSANGAEKTYTFTVSSTDDVIRVSLSWLKYTILPDAHTNSNPTNYPLADLDLFVYGPDGGDPIAFSDQYGFNTEIVSFTPPKSGTYTIVVKQFSSSSRVVYFGLAWW